MTLYEWATKATEADRMAARRRRIRLAEILRRALPIVIPDQDAADDSGMSDRRGEVDWNINEPDEADDSGQ
jgi:hypothetical protein